MFSTWFVQVVNFRSSESDFSPQPAYPLSNAFFRLASRLSSVLCEWCNNYNNTEKLDLELNLWRSQIHSFALCAPVLFWQSNPHSIQCNVILKQLQVECPEQWLKLISGIGISFRRLFLTAQNRVCWLAFCADFDISLHDKFIQAQLQRYNPFHFPL